MGTVFPPQPVAQERSAVTELETMLLNWKGCFSSGVLTHTTDQCRTLDESFPFLPTGWQAERIGEQFILGSGPPARPQSQQMGNAD